MALLKNLHQRSYYRLKLILTFSSVTILLVLILSRVSFYYLKDIYLSQLSDQVQNTANLLSERIDHNFFLFLQVGEPTESAEEYFSKILPPGVRNKNSAAIFIFDTELKIIFHSDPSVTAGYPDPRLVLNMNEIERLDSAETTTSLPFKGDDEKWYLWGFKRLSDNYWLGIQESAAKLEKVDQYSRIFWMIGLVGVFVTIILGWIAANSITKPINQLVSFSEAIGTGNNTYPKPENMKGEMRVLSDAMDEMRSSLIESQIEKEHILAQIAHEIRNPLGGIELFAGLIREDHSEKETHSEYLDKILSEVSRLKALINAFLNYSRPLKASPEWVNLTDLFKELKIMFSDILSKNDITLEIAEETHKVYFDYGHLKQILINLISNGIESINSRGAINTCVKENKNKWQILVADSGTGIKPENVSSIFNPFYTTRKNGTGLGLAVCKKLAQENGAFLFLKNNYPYGCTFIITNSQDHEII